jgi:subtilisin family serine protease
VVFKNHKKAVFSLVILCVLFSVSSDQVRSEERTNIIIGSRSIDSKSSIVNIVRGQGGRLTKDIPRINALVFEIPSVAYDKLASSPGLRHHVRYIEREGSMSIQGKIEFTPNDPGYPLQWGYPAIDAPKAWDLTMGDPGVIVAVIDTGVDYNHADLNANVDPSLGWDFYNGDSDPADDNGHGTHVAGTIAAETNNGIGVAGTAGMITIMPIKVCSRGGSCPTVDIADGIIFAADNGAKILSLSLGGFGYSQLLDDATRYAFNERGALIVAAAGNYNSGSPFYPAAYKRVIGVAALDQNSDKASFSNWGWDNVYISAPGVSVYSTYPGNKYVHMSGTSMATPHVSGVAALYWSVKPSWTNVHIGKQMLRKADDLGTNGWAGHLLWIRQG